MRNRRTIWGVSWLAMQLGIFLGITMQQAVSQIFYFLHVKDFWFWSQLPILVIVTVICLRYTGGRVPDAAGDEKNER